jgi:hypothetical protein
MPAVGPTSTGALARLLRHQGFKVRIVRRAPAPGVVFYIVERL